MSRLLLIYNYTTTLRSASTTKQFETSSTTTIKICCSSSHCLSMLILCGTKKNKLTTPPPLVWNRQNRWLSVEVGGKLTSDSSSDTKNSRLPLGINGSSDSSAYKSNKSDTTSSTVVEARSMEQSLSGTYSTSNGSSNRNNHRFLQGEVLDFARDLRKIRPGDTIHVPYEITITESVHDFWHSAFHSQDRITTSTPFARKIGLQDRILPFSLVLFLTSSMTHADAAKVQVSYENVIYHWPCFAGDTFTKLFQVVSVKNTSDGNHTVIHFACQLVNQRGRICMTAGKRMMFPFTVENANSPVSAASTIRSKLNEQDIYLFRNHILSQARTLLSIGSHSLKRLHTGHLILHRMNRSVSLTQSQQLASLARLTHERHFDVRKYDATCEILVPGGVVLGLTLSAGIIFNHIPYHTYYLTFSSCFLVKPTFCHFFFFFWFIFLFHEIFFFFFSQPRFARNTL